MSDAKTGGRLTTHVLDTASGRPAAGLGVALYRIDGETRSLLRRVSTDADGRIGGALIEGDALRPGDYELVFDVGAYFARGEPTPFLGRVPVRFGVADADAHYHVPLLVSPFGYSTYRGS